MSQSFRQTEILDIARRSGKVTVDGLADHFGVTLQTIRRDLGDLAETGQLERVHGGAMLPSGTRNIDYEERRNLNAPAKQAIARICAARIPNDTTLFLNIGTTTEAVAQALLHHETLMVVTNNLNVATTLSAHSGCQTVVTGGRLRPRDGGLVGPLAVESIGRFRFDLAVIGCSALDPAGDLLDFDLDEVSVSQAILRQSRKTWLVADAAKLHRSAPARIATLAEIDLLITDAPLPPSLAERCAGWGTEVILTA